MLTSMHVPDVVARELRADEQAQWIGRPDPTKYAVREGKHDFVMGLGGCVVLVWFGSQAPVIIWVLIPEAVVGLVLIYYLSGPLREYWRARRTVCVITNQRLLILNGFQLETKSVPLTSLGPALLELQADGSGSVIFIKERIGEDDLGGDVFKKIGFKHIPNARETAALVEQLKKQALDRID